jgi:hypothetical protein
MFASGEPMAPRASSPGLKTRIEVKIRATIKVRTKPMRRIAVRIVTRKAPSDGDVWWRGQPHPWF